MILEEQLQAMELLWASLSRRPDAMPWELAGVASLLIIWQVTSRGEGSADEAVARERGACLTDRK
jgi:hypothetical protein